VSETTTNQTIERSFMEHVIVTRIHIFYHNRIKIKP